MRLYLAGLFLLLNSPYFCKANSRVNNFIREYQWNKDLVANIKDYEVVYPFQVRERNRVGIDTRSYYYTNGTYHHDSATFVLRFGKGKRFKMHLRRNQELVPLAALFREVLKDGFKSTVRTLPENCYFQGRLHNQDNSLVALSTCNGLRGVIFTERETWEIHPLRGGDLGKRHPHVLFKARWDEKALCSNGPNTEWSSGLGRRRIHQRRRLVRDTKTTQKYLELGVVADYGLAEMLDFQFSQLLPYVLESVNIIDVIYQRNLNTRVSLVFLEGWTGGSRITISDSILPTMLNWVEYVTRDLYHVHKDLTLFLTPHRFEKQEQSMSTARSVCTARGSGIAVSANRFQSLQTAAVMAHTIGHILGMGHDDDYEPRCPCPDPRGCGMLKAIGEKNNAFTPEVSSCSKDEFLETLNSGSGRCLFNKPLEAGTLAQCGNRKVDQGEECDCGSIEECEQIDKCCDPVTCKLKAEAECASGPCCNECKLIPKGRLCRASENECDVEEVCDGKLGFCPQDARKIAGTKCSNGLGLCYLGSCTTPDLQCEWLWGPGAKKADSQCFETFNTLGSFNGHCGEDEESGEFRKCEPVNAQCGLLHCQGGSKEPFEPFLDPASTFMISQVVRDEVRLKCKIVTETKHSLVLDGSRCGEDGLCLSGACVPMADLLPTARCPTNNAALHCSGHGVCSTLDWCFCDPGFTGHDCSSRLPRLDQPARFPPNQSETAVPATHAEPLLNTVSMLVILGGVIGGVFLLILFLLLCYRRRTHSALRKKKASQAVAEFEKYSEASSFDAQQRSIKFGSMPSYRDEKRKQKRILHKIHEVADERDSVSNRSRESGSQAARAPELRYPLLPSASPGAESESAYRIFERSLRKLEEYEYANPYHTPITSQGIAPAQQSSPQSEYWGGVRSRPPLAVFSPQPARSTSGTHYVAYHQHQSFVAPLRSARGGYATDTEIGYTPRRRPSIEKRSSGETDVDRKTASPPRSLQTPERHSCATTDRTSPTNSVASSSRAKPQPLKLRNIEYLLKQLDTPRTTSPSSSAELSAPEADAHFEEEQVEEAGSNTESHRDTQHTFHPADPPRDSPSANFHNHNSTATLVSNPTLSSGSFNYSR